MFLGVEATIQLPISDISILNVQAYAISGSWCNRSRWSAADPGVEWWEWPVAKSKGHGPSREYCLICFWGKDSWWLMHATTSTPNLAKLETIWACQEKQAHVLPCQDTSSKCMSQFLPWFSGGFPATLYMPYSVAHPYHVSVYWTFQCRHHPLSTKNFQTAHFILWSNR